MKDPNTEPIRNLRWLEIYQIGQALLNRNQHRSLESVLCSLFLWLGGIFNLEIASKYGLDNREILKLRPHFHDDPIIKAWWGLSHIRGLDPVQGKMSLREFSPPAQGLPEDAELTEEMLSGSPLTIGDVYRMPTMCLALC